MYTYFAVKPPSTGIMLPVIKEFIGLATLQMFIFAEFGEMADKKPEDVEVQLEVRKLQDYIL